jgi:hypothetical protein
MKHWEAFTSDSLPTAWEHEQRDEPNGSGDIARVLVCGHRHQTEEAAEACADRLWRRLNRHARRTRDPEISVWAREVEKRDD